MRKDHSSDFLLQNSQGLLFLRSQLRRRKQKKICFKKMKIKNYPTSYTATNMGIEFGC